MFSWPSEIHTVNTNGSSRPWVGISTVPLTKKSFWSGTQASSLQVRPRRPFRLRDEVPVERSVPDVGGGQPLVELPQVPQTYSPGR